MAMDSPTLLAVTDRSGLPVSFTEPLWSDITLDFTTVKSDNDTGSEWTSLDTAEQIFEGAILCLMIALTMLGNSLVVLAVCLEKKLRTFENFFFASLAIADLSIALLVLPLSVRVEFSDGLWDLGPQVCDLFIFTDVACCTASILHLCTIGINRCRSITSPLHYVRKQTFRRAVVMIVLIWLVSFLIACPPLIGWPQSRNRTAQLCEYDVDKLYVVYSSCGSFFIPLLVMVIVYTRIYQVSRRGAEFRRNSAPQLNDNYHHQPQQKNNSQSLYQARNHYEQVHSCPPSRRRPDFYRMEHSSRCTTRPKSVAAASAEVAFTGYSKPEEVQVTKPVLRRIRTSIFTFHPPGRCDSKKRFNEVKTVKTLGIIMGAFVVCWLPFFLLYVIKPFCINCQIPKALDRFVLWLGYLNSLLNPIIYICCKPLFRVTFKRILLLAYCRRKGDWRMGKPVQRGILVNSSHQNRPNSSSDGPSGGRRKRPGRVMFADCPQGELYNEKEPSLSRTPTLPPERDSDGVVTYRDLPPRDYERQSMEKDHTSIPYDHQVLNANSNNNCLYMRKEADARAGGAVPQHFRRGDVEHSSSGSANDVSGSKLCCAGSRSRSSDTPDTIRNGSHQRRTVVEVEIAREVKDHCGSEDYHCKNEPIDAFSTRSTFHSDSMNREETEDGDTRGDDNKNDPLGNDETLVESQDILCNGSLFLERDLNFREVLV